MAQQQNPDSSFSTPLGSRPIQDQPTPDGQREGKVADVAPVQSNIANTANTTPGMDENSTPWIQRHPLDELPAPLQVGWSPSIPMPPQATTVPLLKPAYQVLQDMTPGQDIRLRDNPSEAGYTHQQPGYQTVDESAGERP